MTRLVAALAGVAFLAATGSAAPRLENRVAGHTLALSPGWRLVVLPDDGTSLLSTYAVRDFGEVSERPPRRETSVRLHDGGPVWALPGWARRIGPLPRSLPPESTFEGFGQARLVRFRADGHIFEAWVKGVPRRTETLAILRSLRVTPYGRSLALVISSHVENGVRLWRVGNPRSARKLIVVGCPHGPCPGLAVTQRLVNGVRPLAADLHVVQLLRGREDLLRRLIRRLRPEATIRLGNVRDPNRMAGRIATIAR